MQRKKSFLGHDFAVLEFVPPRGADHPSLGVVVEAADQEGLRPILPDEVRPACKHLHGFVAAQAIEVCIIDITDGTLSQESLPRGVTCISSRARPHSGGSVEGRTPFGYLFALIKED